MRNRILRNLGWAALSALTLFISGCEAEVNQPKLAAGNSTQPSLYGGGAPVRQAAPGATAQTDIQTLQDNRVNDQNVLNEANKAVGVVGADPLRR